MSADQPQPRAGAEGPPPCSAKGCRAAATTDLRWRNPTLHDAARVKHWLACDEHADFLADFLARRNFLLGRAPLAAP
ncbi:MAG TPA: hypothetical protein VHS54_04980 [Jatrophihabitans sp.]|nr:hypothetical protein [Jatrophihabitans sp.]